MSVEIAQQHWQTSQEFLWQIAELFGLAKKDLVSEAKQLDTALIYTFMGDLLWIALPAATADALNIARQFAQEHDAEWLAANMSKTEWLLRFNQRVDYTGVDWAFCLNQGHTESEPRSESNPDRIANQKNRWVSTYDFMQSLK